jgi:hypothetical protein
MEARGASSRLDDSFGWLFAGSGALAFVASFYVEYQRHYGGELFSPLIAGVTNPLFFVGLPLGWYWLHRARRPEYPHTQGSQTRSHGREAGGPSPRQHETSGWPSPDTAPGSRISSWLTTLGTELFLLGTELFLLGTEFFLTLVIGFVVLWDIFIIRDLFGSGK